MGEIEGEEFFVGYGQDDGGVPADVLPGHQGRIGGHPVQNLQIPRLPDLGKVGCVDEEFHD